MYDEIIMYCFAIFRGILDSKCYKYALQFNVVYEVILYMNKKYKKNLMLNILTKCDFKDKIHLAYKPLLIHQVDLA